MTAADWKSKARQAALDEAVDLELPSGMVIRARRPDPSQLLLWGYLPLGLAAEVQSRDAASSEPGAAAPATKEEILAGMRLSRDLLLYCCVEPSVSLTPAAGEIHPKDV